MTYELLAGGTLNEFSEISITIKERAPEHFLTDMLSKSSVRVQSREF